MIEQQRVIQGQAAEIGRLKAGERPATAVWFVAQNALQPFTTGGVKFMAGLPRDSVTPRRLRITLFIATTNNATNYWTITLRNAATTTVASTSTAALAPDTWYTVDVDAFAIDPLTVAGDKVLQINLSRSGTGGAPGALQLHPVLLVL
jgi:hypothetical protein